MCSHLCIFVAHIVHRRIIHTHTYINNILVVLDEEMPIHNDVCVLRHWVGFSEYLPFCARRSGHWLVLQLNTHQWQCEPSLVMDIKPYASHTAHSGNRKSKTRAKFAVCWFKCYGIEKDETSLKHKTNSSLLAIHQLAFPLIKWLKDRCKTMNMHSL